MEKWIYTGETLNIPEIDEVLKLFRNWKIEIANYHLCRFINVEVEGRNNKIKALQRRCYFLRNRKVYEQHIYLECNHELVTAQKLSSTHFGDEPQNNTHIFKMVQGD